MLSIADVIVAPASAVDVVETDLTFPNVHPGMIIRWNLSTERLEKETEQQTPT
jgi:hypothetical protein